MSIKKIVIICLLLYSVILMICEIRCGAEYIYDNQGGHNRIKYENSLYEIAFVDFPYSLVNAEENEDYNDIYIRANNIQDFLLHFDCFVFYSNIYDDNNNFIVVNPGDSSLQTIYVKDEFVYPTIYKNDVDEVWLSLSSTYNIIKDSDTVNHILECAKSNGELSLDKEVYEQIKSTSWDNHCFYLKYKGYPLVEEFHIEETEDGRYIVDQYTASEYDSIYLEEHK